MSSQPLQPSPALAAIGHDFTADDATVVLASRQPGDALSSTRALRMDDGRFAVLSRMPQAPVASHLGAACDIAVAQGIRDGLGAGEAMLTLSLRLEQLAPALPGETLRGAGQLLSARPEGIVARGVLVGEDGRPVAEALGRFMAVDGPGGYTMDASAPTEAWGDVPAPTDWAEALPLAPGDDETRFTLVPGVEAANSARILHGGIQMRLHEMAGSRVLTARAESQEQTRPLRAVAIETTYHRPMPVGGPTLDVDVEVLKDGRRVAITQSRVRDPQGRLLGSSEIVWARS